VLNKKDDDLDRYVHNIFRLSITSKVIAFGRFSIEISFILENVESQIKLKSLGLRKTHKCYHINFLTYLCNKIVSATV
jgi:hypothetical protein